MKKILVFCILVLAIVGSIFAAGCTMEDNSADNPSNNPHPIVKHYEFEPHTIGNLEVDSEPRSAMVWIDGEYKSTTYAIIPEQYVGIHQIKITKEGYEDYSTEVYIEPDTTTYLTVSLQKRVE